MDIYPDRQPFLYAIGWTSLDRWYLGVKYAKGCKPSDLWTTYFTSSDRVAAFRLQHGEPDHIEVLFTGSREQVVAAEAEYLTEFNMVRGAQWLNRCAGGKTWFTDEASIEKMKKPKSRWRGKALSEDEKARIAASRARGYRPEPVGRGRVFTAFGTTGTLRELCNSFSDFSLEVVSMRILKGWTIEDALVKPKRRRSSNKTPVSCSANYGDAANNQKETHHRPVG